MPEAVTAPAPSAPAAAPAPVAPAAPIVQTRAQLREAAVAALKAAPTEQPAPATPAPADTPAPAEAKPPEPEKKPEPVSPKLAELAKRDRELREERKKLDEQRAAVEAFEAAKKKAALDPAAGLQALGLSLEQVIDFAANGGKAPPGVQEKSAHDELRAEVEALKKAREEEAAKHQKALEEHARNQWRSKALETAKASEKFEYVSAVGDEAVTLAMNALEQHFQETGEPLPMEEALSRVEAQLGDLVDRLLTTKKSKSKLGFRQPAESAASESGQRTPPRTLTNSTAAMAPPPSGRPLTREERKAAAAAALRSGRIDG
jgi:hypothetical protein